MISHAVCWMNSSEAINVVRSPAQVEILRAAGAAYVCDSSVDTFAEDRIGDYVWVRPKIVIKPVEGQFFSGQVALFSDPQTTGQVGQYLATINWGDNTAITPGVITYGGGTGFTVAGSHTYAEESTAGGFTKSLL